MKNIVAFGSHYDDIELGCGGTLAKYHTMGYNTYGVVVTRSDYEDRDANVARREGEAAAEHLGYNLIRLEKPTRGIVYGRELVQEFNEIIKKCRADIIFTHWLHDVHQDHAAVAQSVVTAARHYPCVLMYRSNWYQTTYDFRGNFYVSIDKTMDKKVEAIRAHQSEYEKNGKAWLDFFVSMNHAAGSEIGVEYAEKFEVVKWLDH